MNKDPELVDDRSAHEEESDNIELPVYDPTQFDLPDDFEYTEELDGADNGSG